MLLVPGGRRQHHVGQQGARRHPEVGREQQVELALRRLVAPGDIDRGGRRLRSAITLEWVPSRYLRKYSLPLAEEPSRLERHSVSTRGQFCGASTSSTENRRPPLGELGGDVRPGILGLSGVDRGGRLVGQIQRIGVELGIERHPAQPRRLGDGVRGMHPGEMALGQRRGERVGGVAVEPVLVGVHVPVRGADHGPRRPGPVQGVGQIEPAGDRPALLLADVVRPAAAVAAHRSGEQQHGQDRPVGRVAVEPLADPGAHDDHGPAARVDRVGGELASDPDGGLGRNAGDRRLPGRGERPGRVVVAGRPVARQPVPGHAVVGEHQVEDGGDQAVADPRHRDAAAHHVAGAVGRLEVRQQHLGGLRLDLRIAQRERRHDALQVEIPLAHAGVGVAEADRAVRHHRPAAGRVQQHRLPRGFRGR